MMRHYFLSLIFIPLLLILGACAHKTGKESSSVTPATLGANFKKQLVLTFNCRSVILTSSDQRELDRLLDSILGQKYRIVLKSFTPALGSEDVNIATSYTRAKSVADYMAVKGVDLKNIQINSYGGAYALPSDHNKPCRVEVFVGA